jgi:multidrug efflux pump subunit AcrB
MDEKRGVLAGLIDGFLRGNFAVLLRIVSLIAGAIALKVTPREEEPQIVVPLADVLVMVPGSGAEEVEKLVSARLERLLYQIDGVEYVYSASRPGMAVVTVRFFVGEDREKSLIKLYNKIFQNIDRTTPGVAGWVVKPIEIDDVPILAATLHSATLDTHGLRRVAEEVSAHLQRIPDTSTVTLHGGEPRVLSVRLDTERLAAYSLSPGEVVAALKVSNAQVASGAFETANTTVQVEAGPFLRDADEVRNLMVGVQADRPVYLRDVAEIVDGPDEPSTYTRLTFGPAHPGDPAAPPHPAVTIAVAKKKGTNAVRVAAELRAALDALRGNVIPDDVRALITRDYGVSADRKVNDLVENLVLAMITVIGMIAIAMSWREGVIVGLAIPVTYALTLLANYLFGYSINRVTLFALILALGLLVDDPIVGVENISRYLAMRRYPRLEAVSRAMHEVLPPVVLATLAIVISFVPMSFISGMMGPYMAPMALNVPLTMLSSMLVSFAITPWLASKLLKPPPPGGAETAPDIRASPTYRVYRRLVAPLIESRRKARLMLAATAVLFVLSAGLALTGLVPLKMLPYDNKNEFQVVIDLPEYATLEATDGVARRVEDFLRTVPEVEAFTTTVGGPSPMDFNGLVRHYYLRQGPHVADIRVNLVDRKRRRANSHALVLRLRRDIENLARAGGADIKLVELPPGPPVLATVVAEIYGRPEHTYADLVAAARALKARLAREEGVVEADDSAEAAVRKLFFAVDREKAGLNGIAVEDVAQTLRLALGGLAAGAVHVATDQNELPILLRLPRALRADPERLKAIPVKGRTGHIVQLGELGRFESETVDTTLHHKNLRRVVYVTAETAGRGPAYVVLAMGRWLKANPLPDGITADWRGEGEWKITLDVFRDLGVAFGVALLGISVLLVYETRSSGLPLVIMLSIPLTVIGIMPGFWLLNGIAGSTVGGYRDPVFFTATAMIGMIALGGIVQRNAIILIDFIKSAVARGRPLREAIIESGAVRFRPIFLTAGTTLLGAWPITFDPIFSGLAWSIIFGLFVATAFTLIVIPVVYNLLYGTAHVPRPEKRETEKET